MKKLFLSLLWLLCLPCFAQLPGPNTFSPLFILDPFHFYGDYADGTHQFNTVLTAAWPNTTSTETALSVMPANMPAMVWAFATGTCGSETWSGTSPANIASANVSAWVSAGKMYEISTGGAAGTFKCASNANYLTFLNTYNSANMIGVIHDIEGSVSGGNFTATISGNTLTCTANCGNVSLYTVLETELCPPATMVISGSGPYTLNNSGCISGTYFGALGIAYTYTDITNLITAIANAQATYPNLRFGFSIGSYGGSAAYYTLNVYGVYILNQVRAQGVKNVVFNIQTLDMTNDSAHCVQLPSLTGCDMAKSTIQAAVNLNTWFKIPYANIAVTPMIGTNDTTTEQFTIPNVCPVAQFARGNKLAGISFWMFNRDRDCPAGTTPNDNCNSYGTAGKLGFTNAFLKYCGY